MNQVEVHPSDPEVALASCFEPARLNGLMLKNRFIKAGTFENMTPGGVPGEALAQFHGELADGGIAMTTLGYCAVEDAGRLNENMLYMNEGIRQPLSEIIESLHRRGTRVSGQMGHCGGFSKNKSLGRRPKGPSVGLNMLGIPVGMLLCDAMTPADIDALVDAYHEAAVFMKSVGFDALEIHFGHGYGLCQFMSPKTNKRRDEYGGSLENRMRLPLRVLAAVRKAVGSDFPVLGKISMSEGVRGGLTVEDSIEIARLLDRAGIDGLIPSSGTSTMNPMLMFRGDSMLPSIIANERSRLMRFLFRLAGPKLFKTYPYEDVYLLENAKRIREVVGCNMIYIGGASSNESFARVRAAGFDFIQLGRALLADPDLPNRAVSNTSYRSRCIHCNRCVGTIEDPAGIHCPRFNKQSGEQAP